MANIITSKGVIAILTGGGDVPGLNPAIRAVTIEMRNMISENLQTDELDLINKFDSKKNSSTKLNIEKFINDNKIV